MKQKPMRVIVLAATKGGVGKTTLSAALAVRASQESKRVALIDADPQNSLERWWELRGEPDNPQIMSVGCSAEGIGLLLAEGWEWVIVDTPPGLVTTIGEAISQADFVLIPTRASAVDVEAIDHVVELCESYEKPFAFILNAVEPNWKLTKTASEFLSEIGPVLDQQIAYRRAYIAAMTAGKSGPEVERGESSAQEIDAVWAAIKKRVAKAAKARA